MNKVLWLISFSIIHNSKFIIHLFIQMVSPKILLAVSFVSLAFLLVFYTAVKLSQPITETSQNSTSKIKFTHDLQELYEASQSALLNLANNPHLLPFPGLLPNHPLYWTKMIRDRIQLITTVDPTQKMQLLLLFADKRLAASQLLIATNDDALGISTLTKAEKYLLSAYEIYRNYDQPEQNRYRQNLGDAFSRHLIYTDIAKKQIGQEFKLDNLNQLQESISIIYDTNFKQLNVLPQIQSRPNEASPASVPKAN